MGLRKLFRGLFGNKNPTKDWVEDTSRPLEVDFGTPSLCGVAPDQPITDLSWLGPADEADDGRIAYLSKGLTLFPIEGRLDSWCIEFRPHDGFEPFQAKCQWNGQQLELSRETTPDRLIAQIGEPDAHDVDNSNKTDMMHYGQAEVEFADNENGQRTLSAVVCLHRADPLK